MMKILRSNKGEYGYIKRQTKRVLVWTVFLFAVAFSLFIGGYIALKTKKNLLTIVAVLGLLPASKSLVNLIMFLRAKGCSEALHTELLPRTEGLSGLYDLYFTTYKCNYPVSHMVLKGNVLCGITEDAAMDTNACQKHLEEMLTQDGYKNINVKIFQKKEQYLERLAQLQELQTENNRNHDAILEMLLSISL